jgi:hypothetical protein
VSVLNAFLATYSYARQTFGQGSPAAGTQFDSSGPLRQQQANVETAAPGARWTGTAAGAYGNVNQEHGRVLGELAGLDQRLAREVDQSAAVVAAGRRDLDKVRKWVLDAASRVPRTPAGERMLVPIVHKGIGDVAGIVQRSNSQLNGVGGRIRGIGTEYQALGNQKFGGLPETGPGDGRGDGVPPPVDPKQAEHDVHQVLAGKATPEELARVRAGLTLSPDQHAAYDGGRHVDLGGQQKQILGQMQAQMHGMSIDDIRTAEQRLGGDKGLIGDSMQMMSGDKFDYAKVPLEVGAPGSLTETSEGGNGNQLPTSVKDLLSQPAVKTDTSIVPGTGVQTITEYPNKDDLRTLAGIVQDGSPSVQQGTYLDKGLMDRGAEMLAAEENEKTIPGMVAANQEHVDPTVQDILRATGRDTIVSHDMITDTSTDPLTQRPRGETFLQNMSAHNWADDGAAARTTTDWIDDAAKSDKPATQMRAGETAQSLANYLGDHGEQLLHLPEHPAGINPGNISIGEQNHALVQGYAEALIPFQDGLIGDSHNPGFHVIEDVSGSDLPKTRALFAAIDSDQTAANNFNSNAYDKVVQYQHQFAQLAGESTNINTDDPRSRDMAHAGRLAGLIDGGALTEASARQSDALQAATDAYNLKKNALGYMFGLGTDQIPYAGGLADAMGKDAVVNSLLGAPPTLETVDGGPHVTTHGDQFYQNLATYTIANELVDHNVTGVLPPQQWHPEGHLLTPQQVLADPNLGIDAVDDYYLDLYSYLAKPENHNLAQYFDQFNSEFGSATKK